MLTLLVPGVGMGGGFTASLDLGGGALMAITVPLLVGAMRAGLERSVVRADMED